MIENYIFDFGNVLAEFIPEKLTAPFVSDAETRKYISEIVFARDFWNKLDRGTITDCEVREIIRNRVPKDLEDIACKVYDNWVRTLTPVKNMQKLVCDIHKSGKGLYLLSNISIGFAESYEKVEWIEELLNYFDGVVLSGPIGMVKPDRDIFEYLLKSYNLKAEECLFIDDSEENIKGADVACIKGYLFDGDADRLRKYICL